MDLPANIDVPVGRQRAGERTWILSDNLSNPSVLLTWGQPFRSVEEMNRHLLPETGDVAANARASGSWCSATTTSTTPRRCSRPASPKRHSGAVLLPAREWGVSSARRLDPTVSGVAVEGAPTVSARATVTGRKEVTVLNRPSDDGKSKMLRIVRGVCANVSG